MLQLPLNQIQIQNNKNFHYSQRVPEQGKIADWNFNARLFGSGNGMQCKRLWMYSVPRALHGDRQITCSKLRAFDSSHQPNLKTSHMKLFITIIKTAAFSYWSFFFFFFFSIRCGISRHALSALKMHGINLNCLCITWNPFSNTCKARR